jgi:hypothetical protein
VRLAFHDAVTFRVADGSGGPHAVINAKCTGTCENNLADNAGLQQVIDFVAPTYSKYSSQLSLADFWALAANVALDFSVLPPNNRNRVTSLADSQFKYRWGRTDLGAEASSPASRFPNAELGWAATRAIFVTGIGLTATETVALFGAHSIGRLNSGNSGYSGPWDNQPTIFDNGYYTSMINRRWTFNRIPDGRGNGGTLSIWKTPAPGTPVDPTAISMLNSDMGIVIDSVETSTQNRVFDNNNANSFVRNAETYNIAVGFANNNQLFLQSFAAAFKKLTEVGYSTLRDLDTATTTTTTTPATTTTTPATTTTTPTTTTPTTTTPTTTTVATSSGSGSSDSTAIGAGIGGAIGGLLLIGGGIIAYMKMGGSSAASAASSAASPDLPRSRGSSRRSSRRNSSSSESEETGDFNSSNGDSEDYI